MTDTVLKTNVGKDAFFDEVVSFINRVREDDTVSHFFVLALHGRGVPEDEDGLVVAPVSFLHNQLDTYTAASIVNTATAFIAMKEIARGENETKQ